MQVPSTLWRAGLSALVLFIGAGCVKSNGNEGRTSGASDKAPAAQPSTPSQAPSSNARVAAPAPGEDRVGANLTEPRQVEGLYLRAPAAWTMLEPTSAMRKAEYSIPGPGGEGNLILFFFGAGEGGGAQANLDRWIAQMEGANGGPAPAERSEMTVQNLSIKTVDVTGTLLPSSMSGITEKRPNYKMVASVIEGPGGPWFLKATGPAATIDAQRGAYSAMLSALRAVGD